MSRDACLIRAANVVLVVSLLLFGSCWPASKSAPSPRTLLSDESSRLIWPLLICTSVFGLAISHGGAGLLSALQDDGPAFASSSKSERETRWWDEAVVCQETEESHESSKLTGSNDSLPGLKGLVLFLNLLSSPYRTPSK